MNGEAIFYMVIGLRKEGGWEKPIKKPTEDRAIKYAKVLAESNPGNRFYIVRAQEYFETAGVRSTILLQSQEDTDVKES